MKRTIFLFAVILFSSMAVSAQDASLYKRLGGYDALAAVTDDFIGRLATDKQLGKFFVGLSNDSKTKVRQHIVDFLCKATGGPCAYTGLRHEDGSHGTDDHKSRVGHERQTSCRNAR